MLLMMSLYIYCLNVGIVHCGCLLYAYSNKYNRQKQQNMCCSLFFISGNFCFSFVLGMLM